MQMANQQSTIQTDLPVKFVTLTHNTIPAKVKQIIFQYEEDGSACSCEMMFEVSGDIGQSMVQHEWFHLFQSARINQATLDADQVVVVRASLRPSIARQYADKGLDAEDVFDSLLPSASSNERLVPLNNSECWMAMELKQAVKLPSELEGEGGSLSTSLLTYWDASGELKRDSQTSNTISLGGRIESYLQSKELKYEKIDEHLLRLRFYTSTANWICLIRIDPDEVFCAIYSIFPEMVPAKRREETAIVMMSENYDLIHGNFEMDEADGELRFRSTLFTDQGFNIGMIGFLLADHLKVMEHYLPIIMEELKE
jgi:hypothetical protein